jgi:uncharacterized membrane protein YphA (DoxX/SURF4 family)
MKLSNIQIVILRLAVGALFLHLGWGKYQSGWLHEPNQLAGTLANYQQHAAGWQAQYLNYVAIPYSFIWVKCIAVGEFLLGASLLLGLLVRLSTLLGMFMLLDLYAANGNLFSWDFFGSSSSALLFFCVLVLFLARAGRWAGLDALLAKSNAKGLMW